MTGSLRRLRIRLLSEFPVFPDLFNRRFNRPTSQNSVHHLEGEVFVHPVQSNGNAALMLSATIQMVRGQSSTTFASLNQYGPTSGTLFGNVCRNGFKVRTQVGSDPMSDPNWCHALKVERGRELHPTVTVRICLRASFTGAHQPLLAASGLPLRLIRLRAH